MRPVRTSPGNYVSIIEIKQSMNPFPSNGIRLRNSPPFSPAKEKKKRAKSIVKLPSVKIPLALDPSNYILMGLIGEGAFSKAYLAKRKADGHKCVVKVYEKQRLTSEERKSGIKRQLEALSISKHPSLVDSIDTYESSGQLGIVMEYFSEVSLAEFARRNRPIDNGILQKITKQICEGLLHLHSFGISHRDIKPDNILIDQEHNIKIIDFGFATSHEQEEVVVAGTPQYMAPELISKRNYDPLKADIWALGVMLYWLATGFFPQAAEAKKKKSSNNIKKVEDQCVQFPVSIHPGLEHLLRKILRPCPKERASLLQILEDTWIKPKSFKDEIDRLRQSKNVPALIQFY